MGEELGRALVATIAFSVVGLIVFGVAFAVIRKLTPFSIRKEIEEDHNVALAVVIGAVILGIAIVVGSAVHGS